MFIFDNLRLQALELEAAQRGSTKAMCDFDVIVRIVGSSATIHKGREGDPEEGGHQRQWKRLEEGTRGHEQLGVSHSNPQTF